MSSEVPPVNDLTPPQQAAVQHVDGPLLILAGPGSGKTRVITRRIAHLLDQGVRERQLLAITFTNKAAREMAERVQALAPGSQVWVSTFHRFCSRLLRIHGEMAGLKSNFTILDTTDQKQAIRLVMTKLDLDTTHYSPDKVLWRISSAKNELVTPERYEERFQAQVGGHWEGIVRKVYGAYQDWLLESNAVDFDDLLVHTALLLDENEELRRKLGERYRYILVDEYQDTNLAQYLIVAALAQRHRNLCVTGDPDQSIYGWRGARIENILRFETDFPETKVIRLEQNFRSLPPILLAADALIVNNRHRKHKDLLTDKAGGDPVRLLRFDDSSTEADGIAKKIIAVAQESGCSWNDFAVFYRVNSLSRELELALTRNRVPFQVAAGVAFFDRAEIRDMLAYLRLIENPADRTAFLRIINKPLRGLGKTSQDKLTRWADEKKITAWAAAARAKEISGLSKKAIAGFQAFAAMLDDFVELGTQQVATLLHRVDERVRYTAQWTGADSEDAAQRLSNVEELFNAAQQYDEQAGDEGSLQGFLEQTALVSDTDRIEESSGRVTLMTLHAAKGLEFPTVFIVGLEEGLLPHERSMKAEDPRQIEEERRLLFVGVTRARERLFLTQAAVRAMHGKTMTTIHSEFEREISPEVVDCTNPTHAWDLMLRRDPSLTRRPARDEESNDSEDWEPVIDIAADRSEDHDVGAALAELIETPEPRVNKPAPKSNPAARPPQLMTGASLLAGDRQALAAPVGFAIGQAVRHPRYGRGVVVAAGGIGPRRSVDVRFEEPERTETFIVSKAPLQPLG